LLPSETVIVLAAGACWWWVNRAARWALFGHTVLLAGRCSTGQ
jgi:hypothetical protein